MRQLILTAIAIFVVACATAPATPSTSAPATVTTPAVRPAGTPRPASEFDVFERQRLTKRLVDLSFQAQLGGEMIVRKVRYSGADQMIIPAYVFAPRDTTMRRPLLLVVHGGIHGDFDDSYAGQVRTLVRAGYVVIAPEYRGSTGYGRAHYDAIDYGGKEVEDVVAARDYAGALLPFVDTSRTGLLGWSHGGFIALHAVLRRPDAFDVAVAHVPVADLPARMRTHSERYQQLFIQQPGFGASLEENPTPYIERSPVAHARKLRTPVLVHAADNDDDVFIIENRNLRDSMVAAGMDKRGLYTYREWHNPPGGHAFSRVDTPQGRESRAESLAFLNRYLKP